MAVVSAGLLMAAGGAWLAKARPHSGAGEADPGELGALRARIRQLEMNQKVLAARQELSQRGPERPPAAGPEAPARAARPPERDEPRKGGDPERAAERAHQSFMHYFSELEAQRTSEPPDPEWSPKTEELIRRFGIKDGKKAPGVSIEKAACGRTLCRVEMHIDSAHLRQRIPVYFHQFVGSDLTQMTMHAVPGEKTAIFYLSRTGTPLPAMSQADLAAMD
jgi:hypothetical protein